MVKSICDSQIMNKEVDTIKLSVEARAAKAKNPETIDVSIGSLYDDNGLFIECNALTKAIEMTSAEDKYTYSSATGGKMFQDNLEQWLFGDELEGIKKEKQLLTLPSLGGTGALNDIFFSYLNVGETLVLANNNWNVYTKMLLTMHINNIQYELFDNNHFNLNGFKKVANQVIEKEHKLVTLINTPNHNPTGYSFTDSEIEEYINYLNSLDNIPIVIIIDVAYLDFASYKDTRHTLSLFKRVNKNILPVIVFSGSKSFSSYGIRFGSMTFMISDQETFDDVLGSQSLITRTRFSSPNKMAISAFNLIMTDEKIKEEFISGLNIAKVLIEKRAHRLIDLLNQNSIPYYPYMGGFFLLIKTKHQMLLYEKLKEQDIFTLPVDQGLRIAICSLKYQYIERLVQSIKDTMDKYIGQI